MLPIRVFDTHIHYRDPATGQIVQIENPTLHHRDEVLVGPADPWLMARVATVVAGVTVTARLGTTLPIGSTVPNPFVLGDEGIPHEHTQLGTGTFEPIAGVEAFRAVGGVTIDAYWLTIQSLYEDGYGYKSGNRYAFGASAASALGTSRWRFRAMVDRTSESAESWSGVVNTTEGNIGRTDVITGLEAGFAIDDDWRVSVAMKTPVYSHVIGGQVDTPFYALLTVSTHAHLWTAKHARPPPIAEPPADWTGVDKADAATDGSAPPLVPVPGKLTVYDFWADWCRPCRQLDDELIAVARRHPGELAVRKVNAIDDDSAAWHAYLAPGGFSLPHVKLFDRAGKLVWERSGAPPALAAAVEDALTGARVGQAPAEPQLPAGAVRVAITVTDDGYTPARVTIPRGRDVVLVFTRTSEKTCAVDVHATLPDGTKIDQRLPLGQPVAIPIHVDRAGDIPFACGMDMVHGTIHVE